MCVCVCVCVCASITAEALSVRALTHSDRNKLNPSSNFQRLLSGMATDSFAARQILMVMITRQVTDMERKDKHNTASSGKKKDTSIKLLSDNKAV